MTNAPDFIEGTSKSIVSAEIGKLITEARDLEARKATAEETLKEVNTSLQTMYREKLPDAFDEAGITKIEVEARGNEPPLKVESRPYYSANIAASWEDERRAESLSYMDSIGHGDLIKTEVTVSFGRDELEAAKAFFSRITDEGLFCTMRQTINHQTLTAWLKDQVEHHSFVPDLEKIGGTVGRIVRIKEVKI